MFVYRERTKSDLDLRNLLKIELAHAWFAYLEKFSPNLSVSIFSVLNHSCPLLFIIICPWCFSILIIFRFPSIQNTVSDLPYHYNSKVRCLVDGVLEKKNGTVSWNISFLLEVIEIIVLKMLPKLSIFLTLVCRVRLGTIVEFVF